MIHLYTIITKYSEYLLSTYYSIISTYLYMKVSHISMQTSSLPQYKSHIYFSKYLKYYMGPKHTVIIVWFILLSNGGIIHILYHCKYISVYEDFSYFYVEAQCTSAQILWFFWSQKSKIYYETQAHYKNSWRLYYCRWWYYPYFVPLLRYLYMKVSHITM